VAILGGWVSLIAYGIVIWAMNHGPMGPVSALRETSILFAALIGKYGFKEELGARRITSCLAIALGAACLGAAQANVYTAAANRKKLAAKGSRPIVGTFAPPEGKVPHREENF
jgi:drug/metabolite transporter (DMT)-like permease